MTGDCRISDMDRHTVAHNGDFVESPDDQYLENNCVDDPVKLCDFQLLENRIMKTVDSVYQVKIFSSCMLQIDDFSPPRCSITTCIKTRFRTRDVSISS